MDENYEWDSEFPGDMELQETWHLGLAGARSRPELEPELGNVNFLAGPGAPHSPSHVPEVSPSVSQSNSRVSLLWSVSCSLGSLHAKALWSLRPGPFTQ